MKMENGLKMPARLLRDTNVRTIRRGSIDLKTEKEMSTEGSVVLISYQNEPAMYARIEAVEPDVKRGWYHVTFLLLTIPPQPVTWILREEYINGEPFTKGGVPVTIKAVKKTPGNRNHEASLEGSETREDDGKSGKIIPFRRDP